LQESSILIAIAAILGAVLGSFATAIIYRMPRDINWISKRSACPKCEHVLGVADLIPVFSFLTSGGKCRYCKTKFGYNYLIIELLMISGFAASAYLFGGNFKTIIICIMIFCTIVICAVDLEHYIIPDEINILLFLTGIAYGLYNGEGYEQLVLMPLFFFALAMGLRYLMFFWKKREGLGLGDVKFFVAAGTFLPVASLSLFLFLSGLIGLIIALIWKLLKKGEVFPFGPALVISLLFCVAFPESNVKLLEFIQDLIHY
jgi:prepilin signal peptidase PulO-like enzyme (type II secretory pathway)